MSKKSGHGAQLTPVPITSCPCPTSGFSDVGFRIVRLGKFDYQVSGMTRGLVRWQREGDLHFITASCWQRLPYLHDCYALAEEALERTRTRYDLDVVGYVFMPEHMHLLVSEPENGLLADALKMMKLSVSLRQGRRPFWQKRYYDANLCTHNARVDCLRYIHRNPVKRGLVENPGDWPWSSYRHYLTGEMGRVRIDSEWARAEARWQPLSQPPVHDDVSEWEM